MTITSAIVLFAVIWTILFFMVLPLGIRTQADEGQMTEGSEGGAPVNMRLRRKAGWTTVWAVIGFVLAIWLIEFSGLSIIDVSWITPPSAR